MSKEYWKPGNMLYPVPAVMVSCAREGETPNIITVAWAGTVCSDPAMVSISVRKERFSHRIIKDTGEFVINLVNRPLVRATDYCGVKSGRDVDKFQAMDLHQEMPETISAPGIEELPLTLECKVLYKQKQDVTAMPQEVVDRYYPQCEVGTPDDDMRDLHTAYIAEIVNAYIIEP